MLGNIKKYLQGAGSIGAELFKEGVTKATPLAENLATKAATKTRDAFDAASAIDWKGIAKNKMVRDIGIGAGTGALGGATMGASDRNGSMLGGALKGGVLGAGLAPGLKYGGQGLQRLGRAMNEGVGTALHSPSLGYKLNSLGNKTTNIGGDLAGAVKSGFQRAKQYPGNVGRVGWSNAKTAAWNQGGRAAINAGAGAAAGAAGWLTADILNRGAGWENVKAGSFWGAVGKGATLGLGYRGIKAGVGALNKVGNTKIGAKIPGLVKGLGFAKTAANHPITSGAVGVAAASYGFQKTKPINYNKRA